jgi:hypothetical protein
MAWWHVDRPGRLMGVNLCRRLARLGHARSVRPPKLVPRRFGAGEWRSGQERESEEL